MNVLTLFAVIGFAAPKDRGFVWYDPNHLLAGHWLLVLIFTIIAFLLIMPRSSIRPFELARELLILIPAVFLYDVARGLVEGRESEAIARATNLVALEKAIGLYWEPAIQDAFMHVSFLIKFMNFTYLLGMWPVIVFVAVWMFYRQRDAYPLYRDAFLISGGIALCIYAMLPVAPPRFVPDLSIIDSVSSQTRAYSLPDAPLIVNQYAAVPSLHFGWVLLVGIALAHKSKGIGWKLVAAYFPVAMFFSIVATGNHFVIDAVAGAAVVLVGLGLSYALHRILGDAPDLSREPVPAFVESRQ